MLKPITENLSVYRSGNPPYGFTLKNGKLYPKDDEQNIIALINRYREQGVSYNRIAKLLTDMQIPTKTNRKWGSWTVLKIYKRSLGECQTVETEAQPV